MPQETAQPRSPEPIQAPPDKERMAALRRLVSIPKNTVSMIGVSQQQETQIKAKVALSNNRTL